MEGATSLVSFDECGTVCGRSATGSKQIPVVKPKLAWLRVSLAYAFFPSDVKISHEKHRPIARAVGKLQPANSDDGRSNYNWKLRIMLTQSLADINKILSTFCNSLIRFGLQMMQLGSCSRPKVGTEGG